MSKALPPDRCFLAPPAEFTDPDRAGVIMIPAPFESTSSYGRNSCHGPGAILDASRQVEFFDAALGFEPFRACGGIVTLEPLDVEGCDGPTLAERLREAVAPWLARGRFVIVLGGEHTSVVGAIRAHCDHYSEVTVLQLDAHSDLRPIYKGAPWSHACAMARVLDFHDALVQVGVRSQDLAERRFVEEQGIPNLYAHEIGRQDRDREDWIGRVVAATRPRVYITLDCDVMDPAVIPATGAPEPGGLTWWQMDALLARLCREREVIGLDVSELAPLRGLSAPEFTVAKLVYRFIGYRFGKALLPSSP